MRARALAARARPRARSERAQVGALDVAHRDVELALVLARVVDRDHVRVVDRGRERATRARSGRGTPGPRRGRRRSA